MVSTCLLVCDHLLLPLRNCPAYLLGGLAGCRAVCNILNICAEIERHLEHCVNLQQLRLASSMSLWMILSEGR